MPKIFHGNIFGDLKPLRPPAGKWVQPLTQGDNDLSPCALFFGGGVPCRVWTPGWNGSNGSGHLRGREVEWPQLCLPQAVWDLKVDWIFCAPLGWLHISWEPRCYVGWLPKNNRRVSSVPLLCNDWYLSPRAEICLDLSALHILWSILGESLVVFSVVTVKRSSNLSHYLR